MLRCHVSFKSWGSTAVFPLGTGITIQGAVFYAGRFRIIKQCISEAICPSLPMLDDWSAFAGQNPGWPGSIRFDYSIGTELWDIHVIYSWQQHELFVSLLVGSQQLYIYIHSLSSSLECGFACPWIRWIVVASISLYPDWTLPWQAKDFIVVMKMLSYSQHVPFIMFIRFYNFLMHTICCLLHAGMWADISFQRQAELDIMDWDSPTWISVLGTADLLPGPDLFTSMYNLIFV